MGEAIFPLVRQDIPRPTLVATDKLFVAGFHMPFPGLGWVERAGGSYRWVPHSYQLNL